MKKVISTFIVLLMVLPAFTPWLPHNVIHELHDHQAQHHSSQDHNHGHKGHNHQEKQTIHHPIHFDAEYAKGTEFGKNLVVSPYTLSLLIGMSVSDCSQKAIANLGMDEVKFTAPVFHGDTIYGSSEVLEKRESKTRKGQGIVTIKTTGKNQDDKVVCTFKRQILIPFEGHAVEDKIENY